MIFSEDGNLGDVRGIIIGMIITNTKSLHVYADC